MATCQRATSARFHPIAACIPARGPPLRTAPTGAKRKPTVTQPHKRVRRRPIPVVRFAKRSAKRLGSEAPRAWKPAMRSGLGLMLMGLLASARQQIAQGWQGNPSSQAVDERRGPHPGQLKTAPMMPDIAARQISRSWARRGHAHGHRLAIAGSPKRRAAVLGAAKGAAAGDACQCGPKTMNAKPPTQIVFGPAGSDLGSRCDPRRFRS
jgi:hypothetical protein